MGLRVGCRPGSSLSALDRGMTVYILSPSYPALDGIGYRCCCVVSNRHGSMIVLNANFVTCQEDSKNKDVNCFGLNRTVIC